MLLNNTIKLPLSCPQLSLLETGMEERNMERARKGLRYHRYLCARPAPLPHLRGLAWMMRVVLVMLVCFASKSPATRIYSLQFCPHSTNEDFEMISLAFYVCIILLPVSYTTCALSSLHHTGHVATRLLVEDFIALLPLCPPLYIGSLLSHSAIKIMKFPLEQTLNPRKRVKRMQPPLLLLVGPHEAEHAAPRVQSLCSEAKPFR